MNAKLSREQIEHLRSGLLQDAFEDCVSGDSINVLCDMALGQAADEPTTENGHIPNGWVHRIDMIYFCKCKGFLGIKHSDLGLYWKCSQCDFSEPVEMPSSLKPPAEGVEATFDEWFNEWAGVGIEAHTKIVADLYHQRQRYKDIARAGWKAARAQVGGK